MRRLIAINLCLAGLVAIGAVEAFPFSAAGRWGGVDTFFQAEKSETPFLPAPETSATTEGCGMGGGK